LSSRCWRAVSRNPGAQALFDVDHRGQAKNSAPANPKDWRATVKELHSLTSFVIVSPY